MESRPQLESEGRKAALDQRTRSRAERRIAHGCDLTVLTESSAFIHSGDAIRNAAAEAFGKTNGLRYDLLALPCLKYAFKRQEYLDLVVGDVLTALDLHTSEQLLVSPACCPSRAYVRRLKGDERLSQTGLRIRGTDINRPRPAAARSQTMIVTCMDHRLHGHRGIASAGAERLAGPGGYDLMTVPGVAKDIRKESLRTDLVVSQLEQPVRRGLKRLVLIAHTDCGKYGGSQAFPSAEKEMETLRDDLEIAARVICRAYPKLRIDKAVALVRGSSCVGIL